MVAPKKDKHPANSNENEIEDLSQNLKGRFDDFAERIEEGFKTMPDILANVLVRALQSFVEAIQLSRNLDARSIGINMGTDISKALNGLKGKINPSITQKGQWSNIS